MRNSIMERFANLDHIVLRNHTGLVFSDLSYLCMRFADLSGAVLLGANLSYTNLAKANLQNADLWHANIRNANLRDADLAGAQLAHANLAGANLTGADLTDTYLAGANLTGADLTDACLENTVFFTRIWHMQTWQTQILGKALAFPTVNVGRPTWTCAGIRRILLPRF